jgi:hypothetical protein
MKFYAEEFYLNCCFVLAWVKIGQKYQTLLMRCCPHFECKSLNIHGCQMNIEQNCGEKRTINFVRIYVLYASLAVLEIIKENRFV